MSRTTKMIIGCVFGLVLGASVACYGLIFDPFSIPFQDFEQLPQDAQLAYQMRSEVMRQWQIAGGAIALASALALVGALFSNRKGTGSKR